MKAIAHLPAINAAKADEFARIVMPTIRRMRDAGMSRLAIARELNAIGMPTARGGAWTIVSIGNVIKRRLGPRLLPRPREIIAEYEGDKAT